MTLGEKSRGASTLLIFRAPILRGKARLWARHAALFHSEASICNRAFHKVWPFSSFHQHQHRAAINQSLVFHCGTLLKSARLRPPQFLNMNGHLLVIIERFRQAIDVSRQHDAIIVCR